MREATAAIRAGRSGRSQDLDHDQAAAVQTALSEHLREVADLLAPTTTRHDRQHLAVLAVLGHQLRALAETAAHPPAPDTDQKTAGVAGKHSAATPGAAPRRPGR